MPILIISLLLVIAGVVIWFTAPILLIGYPIGIALGAAFILALVRKLGRASKHSKTSHWLFHRLTKYKADVYHIHTQREPEPQSTSFKIYDDANDYATVVDVLKRQMRLSASEAKEAATFAMKSARDKPIGEKVRVALQYYGSEPENAAGNSTNQQ